MMEQAYAGYDAWKGWDADRFMELTDFLRIYYRAEFRDVPVAGEKVLEIGFGSGSLLAWLREQGADLYGTELSRQGVALAAESGVTVLDPSLAEVDSLAGRFGVVAAFDVLEHLTNEEIVVLLDKACALLRPGGFLMLRFPNGGSPFGRMIQHGDVTHVNVLTAAKLGQLIAGKPLAMVRIADAVVPVAGGFALRAMQRSRDLLRKGFELGLRALYGLNGPLHPNVVVVARRLSADPDTTPTA